jgi:glycosyltransferase involved in cell wall biosynthesis
MNSTPRIMIAMPLFEGWEHVGDTLNSIRSQTFRNFRVLISVDGGDARSYAACKAHLDDPRIQIVMHERRLRWEGNINWLAGQLREDYFCYWQHDDYCVPEYLETLLEYADRHPHAASVYCDMKVFGTMRMVVKHPSCTGFALQRVMSQVHRFNPAVIRCLIRANAIRASLPIKLASTWSLALARTGELHRVPKLMYFRRIRPESLTHTMPKRSPEEMWRASLDWGLGLLEQAHPLIQREETVQLFGMVADLIVNKQIRGNWQYDFTDCDHSQRLKFVAEFLDEANSVLGLVPYPNLVKCGGPIGLQARRGSDDLWDGEDLLIDAMGPLEGHPSRARSAENTALAIAAKGSGRTKRQGFLARAVNRIRRKFTSSRPPPTGDG